MDAGRCPRVPVGWADLRIEILHSWLRVGSVNQRDTVRDGQATNAPSSGCGVASAELRTCGRRMPKPTMRAGRSRTNGRRARKRMTGGTEGVSVDASTGWRKRCWMNDCLAWTMRTGRSRSRCTWARSFVESRPRRSGSQRTLAATNSSGRADYLSPGYKR